MLPSSSETRTSVLITLFNNEGKSMYFFFFYGKGREFLYIQNSCKLLVEEQIGTREFGSQFANILKLSYDLGKSYTYTQGDKYKNDHSSFACNSKYLNIISIQQHMNGQIVVRSHNGILYRSEIECTRVIYGKNIKNIMLSKRNKFLGYIQNMILK